MGSRTSKKPVASLEIEPINIIGEFIDDASEQTNAYVREHPGKPRKARSRTNQRKQKRPTSK